MTHAQRLQWIERGDEVPLAMQCELAGVPRSSVYRRMDAACRVQLEDAQELKLRELIDE
jgi:putative transposase